MVDCRPIIVSAIYTAFFTFIFVQINLFWTANTKYLARQFALHNLADVYLEQYLILPPKVQENKVIKKALEKGLKTIYKLGKEEEKLALNLFEKVYRLVLPHHIPTLAEKKKRRQGTAW
jgi:hypothetical protein